MVIRFEKPDLIRLRQDKYDGYRMHARLDRGAVKAIGGRAIDSLPIDTLFVFVSLFVSTHTNKSAPRQWSTGRKAWRLRASPDDAAGHGRATRVIVQGIIDNAAAGCGAEDIAAPHIFPNVTVEQARRISAYAADSTR